ncbi:MAG: ADP-ribosylglycohydrolase family protein, partial [Acidobacteriota bacterium]
DVCLRSRELFDAACQQSLVTHGHPRSQICCGLYCLWARAELMGHPEPYLHAVTRTAELLEDQAAWTRELEVKIEPLRSPSTKASGYVVDCLHASRYALEQESFEQVVKVAVSLGDDTDTTAAVAGGIAGVRFGVSAIPGRWLRRLPDREVLDPIVDQLVARRPDLA